MMVPKKSLFIAGAALLCTSVASAQADGKTTFRRYNKPLRTVSLDLETGDITRGPVVQDRAVSTCITFTNTDLGGFVGVDTGSCACEWIDAASKSSGKSEYLTDFVFAYCSAALDTLSGGPGGAAQLFFVSGYAKGGSPAGVEEGRFLLTGLPANTACSSFFGGFTCFFINITFGSLPMCMPDGAIGYGWKFVDLGTDGVLAKTFPFLSCVTSCTGPGPDGQGMTDCVDQYCPPGSLLSTFSFGTTPFGGYFTSISMDFIEATPADTPTTSTTDPLNGVVLVDGTDGATLGISPGLGNTAQTYSHSGDCASGGCGGASNNKVEIRGGGPTSVTVGGCATILCAKPKFIKFGSGGATNVLPAGAVVLPKDLSFCGIAYCAQMTCFNCGNGCTGVGTGLALSNSFTEVVDAY